MNNCVLNLWGMRGGVEVMQTYVLTDQNFPACLPCNEGECLKIVRVEDGSLAEIVNVWLEITKGREIPVGSVVVLFSASHLQLHGVSGYVPDLRREFQMIEKKFRGGVVTVAGVPVLLGGATDPSLIRAFFELDGWFRGAGELFPKAT